MNEEKKGLLIEKLNRKSKLSKLSDKDLYNLIDIYYIDTIEQTGTTTFDGEPYAMGLKFYEDVYPPFYEQIIDACEKERVTIRKGLPKSNANKKTKNVYINLTGTDRDAFTLVHEFAHYVDIINEGKYTPKKRINLYSEAFAYYMENQFAKYLIRNGNILPVLDNDTRRKNALSSCACILNDYMWLYNIYTTTKRLPNYEIDRELNVLNIEHSDPKLYLSRYLIGDIISKTLNNIDVKSFKDYVNEISLPNEIEKRLKKKINITFL